MATADPVRESRRHRDKARAKRASPTVAFAAPSRSRRQDAAHRSLRVAEDLAETPETGARSRQRAGTGVAASKPLGR
jgi:hypothetical protein